MLEYNKQGRYVQNKFVDMNRRDERNKINVKRSWKIRATYSLRTSGLLQTQQNRQATKPN